MAPPALLNIIAVGGMLILAVASLIITGSDHIAQLVVSGIAGWLGHAAATAANTHPNP